MKNALIGQKIDFSVKIHIISIQTNVTAGSLAMCSIGFNFFTGMRNLGVI